ncbi:hypothetical protein T492DRAFT_1150072 [Pavlovales sp. CCMP2436]|nr:hypothetical protein T492DRAFT_1150072 [Pavlovales sp. CCMP2436]|mmetsp:Transcript_17811/g.42168  ORF Transcript_17811/g.42168 Transcript_17811/m.42168 type:complete len:416 (-) Transcript_17811:150-1397(-)
MGEFDADDDDLDGVLAGIDVENEIANPQVGGVAKKKKSKSKAAPKKEPTKMIRAPDGSSFGKCDSCGKNIAAAMLKQYGGYGHECEDIDPTIALKELAAREKSKKQAAADRFEAAKIAAKRELADREACKPKSAYQHFCAWRRVELKDEKPDLDAKVLTSVLADEWAQIAPERKVKWEATAAADKELFDERMAACGGEEGETAEGDAEKPKRAKKEKKEKAEKADTDADGEPAPPKPKYKRARTAFFIFCDRNRARLLEATPGMRMPDVVKALSIEWKEMDVEAKAEYAEISTSEKARLAENPELVPEKKKVVKRKAATGDDAVKRKRAPKKATKAETEDEVTGEDDAEGDDAEEKGDDDDDAEGDAAESEAEEEEEAMEEEKAEAKAVEAAEEAKPERKPKARKGRVIESEDDE